MDIISAKLLETLLTILLGIETNLISARIERGASKREIYQDVRAAIKEKISIASTREDLTKLAQRCIHEAARMVAANGSDVPDKFFKALVEDQNLLEELTNCVLCGYGKDRQLALDACTKSLAEVLASNTHQEEVNSICSGFVQHFDYAITFNDDLDRLRTARFQADTKESLRHIQNTLVSMTGVHLSAPLQRMYVLATNNHFQWTRDGTSLLLKEAVAQQISEDDVITLRIVTAFRSEFEFPVAKNWPAKFVLVRLLKFFNVLEPSNKYSYGLINLQGSRNRADFGDRLMQLNCSLEDQDISNGSDIAIAYLAAGTHMLFME